MAFVLMFFCPNTKNCVGLYDLCKESRVLISTLGYLHKNCGVLIEKLFVCGNNLFSQCANRYPQCLNRCSKPMKQIFAGGERRMLPKFMLAFLEFVFADSYSTAAFQSTGFISSSKAGPNCPQTGSRRSPNQLSTSPNPGLDFPQT